MEKVEAVSGSAFIQKKAELATEKIKSRRPHPKLTQSEERRIKTAVCLKGMLHVAPRPKE